MLTYRSNLRAYAWAGNWAAARAYVRAWRRVLVHLPAIRREHRRLARLATMRDADLFSGQSAMPAGLLWSGVPDLSRAAIDTVYRPLIAGGRTRPLPESAEIDASSPTPVHHA